jgi:DNA-binding beta-propeller fold protein YncE
MRRALIAGIAAVVAGAPGAGAAPPPAGWPVQSGCWADTTLGGCSGDPFASFARPVRVAVSPDGLDVYVANAAGRIGRFRRDRATGALTPAAPVTAASSLADIAVAATRAVAVAGDASGAGRVDVLARDGAGALTAAGCAAESAAAGCARADGLAGAAAVALPPTGPGAYVAAPLGAGHGALTAFGVQPVAQLRCIPAVSATASGDACAAAAEPAVGGAQAVAVSPDGAHVYAGGPSGIAGFARDAASGRLGAEVACLRRPTGTAACPSEPNLGVPEDLAFSPDGAQLYVAAGSQVTVLGRRVADGALSFLQCYGAGTCAPLPDLQDASGIAVSPDGRFVVVAGGDTVRTLRRDPATGLLTPVGALRVASAHAVAAAPDGPHLYVVGGDALAALRIEAAPACSDTAVTIPAGARYALPLACTDADGDAVGRTVVTAPAHGWLGPLDDSAGTLGFTPVIDYTGRDSLTFKATDGTNESAPATVAITVTPPLDALPRSRIVGLPRSVRKRALRRFHGTASDDHGVKLVEIALLKVEGTARAAVIGRCRTLTMKGGLRFTDPPSAGAACAARPFLPAKGTARWTFRLKRHLPRGRYVVYSRAVDTAGDAERTFTGARGNRIAFRVR